MFFERNIKISEVKKDGSTVYCASMYLEID